MWNFFGLFGDKNITKKCHDMLVELARGNNIKVAFCQRYYLEDYSRIGIFSKYAKGLSITIYRNCQNEPDDPEKELLVLAHEYGHYLSFANGYWSDKNTEIFRTLINTAGDFVFDNQVSTQDKQLLFDEEQRAWDFGKDILASLGYKNWKYFNSYRDKMLDWYRSVLKI